MSATSSKLLVVKNTIYLTCTADSLCHLFPSGVFLFQHERALGKRIHVTEILSSGMDVTFTSFLTEAHAFGVWVRDIANSHVTVHEDEGVFADELETFQTESLRMMIGRVIFKCLVRFAAKQKITQPLFKRRKQKQPCILIKTSQVLNITTQ